MSDKHVCGMFVALLLAGFGAAVGCQAELPGGLRLPGGSDEVVGSSEEDPTEDPALIPGRFSAGEENTFDHDDDLSMNGGKDPFEVLAQRQEEGPPEIRTRLHSCQKLQVQALRNILADFGVALDATGDPDTAGELLAKGGEALGAANYPSRAGEALVWTNSGATKLQDIFVQAAPEIIAAMPALEHCTVDGVGVAMFDEQNRCNEDAISCLIARPATPEHVAVCNQAVQSATDLEKGKIIAVASLLSAAHTCE